MDGGSCSLLLSLSLLLSSSLIEKSNKWRWIKIRTFDFCFRNLYTFKSTEHFAWPRPGVSSRMPNFSVKIRYSFELLYHDSIFFELTLGIMAASFSAVHVNSFIVLCLSTVRTTIITHQHMLSLSLYSTNSFSLSIAWTIEHCRIG